jgi:hypothetical protein
MNANAKRQAINPAFSNALATATARSNLNVIKFSKCIQQKIRQQDAFSKVCKTTA